MASNWTEFSESTTIHGLRFVNRTNSLFRRILWLLFVLTGCVFFSKQFYESLSQFFDYKVNTVVHMTNDVETKFPAITICNQNALRKSKLDENKNDPAVQKLLFRTRQFLQFEQRNATNTSILKSTKISGQHLREMYFKYGHTMQNLTEGGMLEFCKQPNGQECNKDDFKRILTYSGQCYTLNSGNGNRKIMHSALSGRFTGVRMSLSVQVDEYSEAIGRSSSTGIVILIHDQRDPPIADTHGMRIGPGLAASISIRKQKMTSLKHPYESQCGDEELGPEYPYSRAGCFRKCQENFVIKHCNCSPAVDTIINTTDVPMCNMEQTFKCAIPEATEAFSKERENCNCPFACESIEYMPTLSYAPFPSDIDARENAIKELTKEGKSLTEEAILNKTIKFRRNMIALEIFYHQLDYLTMKQIPASTEGGLIAEIGGLLGISLGASFLTVIEIGDFLITFFSHKFSRAKKDKQTDVVIDDENQKTVSVM